MFPAWGKTFKSAYKVLRYDVSTVCSGLGFFAYTNGCVIVVEDLNAGSQQHLVGLIYAFSFFFSWF